jgi:hypothetical protein
MWTRAFLLCGVLLSALAAALTPPALAAQSVYHTVAGVRRVAPGPTAPSVLISQQESEPSSGVQVAVAAMFGAALGAALGAAFSDCSGFTSQVCRGDAALKGALVGGVAGAFVGILFRQGTKPPPAPTGVIP